MIQKIFKKFTESDDIIINNISVCPFNKEGQRYAVIAYDISGKIVYSIMPVDTDKKYKYNDILDVIKKAQKVRNITFVHREGGAKYIYICREKEGKIVDIAERNNEYNCYIDGFAEISMDNLKFVVTELPTSFPVIKPFNCNVLRGINNYEINSLEFAVVNTYNACLLSQIFEENEEFNIHTKNNQRVRIEIKESGGRYIDDNCLRVNTIKLGGADSCVEGYETEKFNYIDGICASLCAYKIEFTERWNKYLIFRIV